MIGCIYYISITIYNYFTTNAIYLISGQAVLQLVRASASAVAHGLEHLVSDLGVGVVDLAQGVPDVRQLGADPPHGALEAIQEPPANHPLDGPVAVVLLNAGFQGILLCQERRVDATCTTFIDKDTTVHRDNEELPLTLCPCFCLVIDN